ncbi:hypothetical protein DM02DRAFT_655460 [Periconia macrospinosa]|uniref:Uncharacterized protein n=1 Tax=Periconia macrospinosa TaxID=97972 RepID=A0A2V1DQ19_9PLEO|nr:hypothetical protein DM02DRAFT_655460 [Periconia macrospinosa]
MVKDISSGKQLAVTPSFYVVESRYRTCTRAVRFEGDAVEKVSFCGIKTRRCPLPPYSFNLTPSSSTASQALLFFTSCVKIDCRLPQLLRNLDLIFSSTSRHSSSPTLRFWPYLPYGFILVHFTAVLLPIRFTVSCLPPRRPSASRQSVLYHFRLSHNIVPSLITSPSPPRDIVLATITTPFLSSRKSFDKQTDLIFTSQSFSISRSCFRLLQRLLATLADKLDNLTSTYGKNIYLPSESPAATRQFPKPRRDLPHRPIVIYP